MFISSGKGGIGTREGGRSRATRPSQGLLFKYFLYDEWRRGPDETEEKQKPSGGHTSGTKKVLVIRWPAGFLITRVEEVWEKTEWDGCPLLNSPVTSPAINRRAGSSLQLGRKDAVSRSWTQVNYPGQEYSKRLSLLLSFWFVSTSAFASWAHDVTRLSMV